MIRCRALTLTNKLYHNQLRLQDWKKYEVPMTVGILVPYIVAVGGWVPPALAVLTVLRGMGMQERVQRYEKELGEIECECRYKDKFL